jgi:integrase
MRRWRKAGQNSAVEFKGRPVQNIAGAFRRLVADSGLTPDVVPHVLRHTGVTWGMQNGMDIWDASGYFGMTVQVLTDVYGHHHPDHLRNAAAKMARRR